MKRTLAALTILAALASAAPQALAFSIDELNGAEWTGTWPEGQSAIAAKVQVLLGRGGASPGVIDGVMGMNVEKALRGFEEIHGLPVDGQMDGDVWSRLNGSEPAFTRYTVSEKDVAGLVEAIPEDKAEQARMERLGYVSAAEALAEKFHMDIDFLRHLNPESDFAPGSSIIVANPGERLKVPVAHLIADKSDERLMAYDGEGRLRLSYPATIGSDETPSPSGTHQVKVIVDDPDYTYTPKEEGAEKLRLPPGPNGLVGNVWIGLSAPTYGIHGTPDPAHISRTNSSGCVRLTNWDAGELAHTIVRGIPVEFRE